MKSYEQSLREFTLESTEGKPVEERADALNLIESIIQGEEDLVEKIKEGKVTQYYVPLDGDDEQ